MQDKKIDILLENVEWQDIIDVIVIIQQSFNIHFQEIELAEVKNFGELCDLIHEKIKLEHHDDCTSQQAYYKLSQALVSTLKLEKVNLNPDTLTEDIIPRKNRIKKVRMLEKTLDMKLLLLSPPGWIINTLIVIFLLSLLAFFFSATIAISGLIFSISGFWISNKTGKEINVKTVGELTDHMATNNYLKSRRNPDTINKNELNDVIKSLFSRNLDLDPSVLGRDAKFSRF